MSQSGHPVQRPDGSDVTLKCSYDSLENCELIRNGVVTDVSERFHQYLQPDNRQAKKCSVLIDNLQEVDDADSSCQIRADFKHNNAVKGKDSLLNVNGNVLLKQLVDTIIITVMFS